MFDKIVNIVNYMLINVNILLNLVNSGRVMTNHECSLKNYLFTWNICQNDSSSQL